MFEIARRGFAQAPLCAVVMAQILAVSTGVLTMLGSSSVMAKSAEGCAALQAKYPSLKGKTLVNAINPHTPGYEALDPNDPSKYVGFDIDLGEAIGDCLGFSVTSKPVVFASLRLCSRLSKRVRPTLSFPISTPPRNAPKRLTS